MGRTDRGHFDTRPLVARAVACALLTLLLGGVSARRHEHVTPPPARAAAMGPKVALCPGAPLTGARRGS